jgi:uncharacterized membrane protein
MSKPTLPLVVCFSLLLTTLTVPLAPAQKAPTFTTIDVPGASQTEVNGINMFGTIAGTFVDSAGVTHGFFQMAGGTFQTLDVPGATFTVAFGINSSGTIVGWYGDNAGVDHGYMDINGGFTTIDPPGSTDTNAYGVDDANVIVGTFLGRQKFHGFKLTAFGHFDTLDAPNGARFTAVIGINNTLPPSEAGSYLDSAGLEHGFTDRRFKFTDVTVPGVGIQVTSINSINDKGESVGFYGTGFAGPFAGFRRTATNKFHPVVFPGSTDTRCRGVNNAGVIVGRYTDAAGVIHGFQMTP